MSYYILIGMGMVVLFVSILLLNLLCRYISIQKELVADKQKVLWCLSRSDTSRSITHMAESIPLPPEYVDRALRALITEGVVTSTKRRSPNGEPVELFEIRYG